MTVCSQFVGDPCGKHGPYTFYKAFRYRKNGFSKVVELGGFFVLQVRDENDDNHNNVWCIGELQLLWDDRNNNKALSSSRLYFLPENTPDGRAQNHGQDEVIAMSEKVVLRLDDLVGWIANDVRWNTGCPPSPIATEDAPEEEEEEEEETDADQVVPEEEDGDGGDETTGSSDSEVVVMSYPRYCRYRATLKRLEGVKTKGLKRRWLRSALVVALGGGPGPSMPTVRVLFCRDTFHFTSLEKHQLLCNHLAPNLKGRPRKKKLKENGPDSPESGEGKDLDIFKLNSNGHKKDLAGEDLEEQEFLQSLFKYMRERNTPIERVPHLGFKQINLYLFFTVTLKMGGYEKVTGKKRWKQIYDELGGNPGSTSAATCTRRHYERLLLPYERHTKGEDDRPLPSLPSKSRKASNAGAAGQCPASKAPPQEAREEEESSLSPGSSGPRMVSSADEGDEEDEEDRDGKAVPRKGKDTVPLFASRGVDEKERQWDEFRRKNLADRESARQTVSRATKENHPKPTLVVPPLEVAPTFLQNHHSKQGAIPPTDPTPVIKRIKVEEEDEEVPQPSCAADIQRSEVPFEEPKKDLDSVGRPSVIRHTHSAFLGHPACPSPPTCPWPSRPRTPTRVPLRTKPETPVFPQCPVRTVTPFHQSPYPPGWPLRERAPLATRDDNCCEGTVQEDSEEEEECSFVALDLRVKKSPDNPPNQTAWPAEGFPKELDLSMKGRFGTEPKRLNPVPSSAAAETSRGPSPPTVRKPMPPPLPLPLVGNGPPVYPGHQYYIPGGGKVPFFPEYGAHVSATPYYGLAVPQSVVGGYVPPEHLRVRPGLGESGNGPYHAAAPSYAYPYPSQFYSMYYKDVYPPEWRP